MAEERELRIRATADTADAKRGLEDLKQGTDAVSEAMARAQTTTEQYAAVADSGLKGVDVALYAAQGSVKGLEEAIGRAKAAGAPIPPGAAEKLEAFRAVLTGVAPAVKEAGDELGKTTPKVEEHAASTTKATHMTAEFRSMIPLASRELGPFGSALNQLAKSQNAWIADMAKGLIPLAALGGAIALMPRLMKGAEQAGTDLGNAYTRLVLGVHELDENLEKANATVAAHDAKLKATADAHDVLLRAETAAAAGLIAMTQNTQLLLAQELAREALMHRTITATGDLAKALKDLGIVETVAAEDTGAKMTAFLLRYQAHMLEGSVAADRFAKANKAFLQQVIDDAVTAGTHVPPEFQKIIDKIHVVPKEYDEANKAIEKHKENIEKLTASLAKHEKGLTDDIGKIEAHRRSAEVNSDAELRKVQTNLDAQFRALNDLHARGEISERDFTAKYAELQNQQVEARRTWEREVSKINDEAAEKANAAREKEKADADAIVAKINAEAGARAALELNKESARKADAERHAEELRQADEVIAKSERRQALYRLDQKLIRDLQQDQLTAWESIAGRIDGAIGSLERFLGLLPQASVGSAAGGAASGAAGAASSPPGAPGGAT